MTGNAICDHSVEDLCTYYRNGALSPVEVVASLSERIEALNPTLNAFTTLALDEANDAARDAEAALTKGDPRPLLGVPIAVKDIIDTSGLRTTYGSSMFAENVPRQDAAIVANLKRAGAIIMGKSATHEFAWGFTTDNPHYGPTRNPWNTERIPGGSSGGSAAAVAAKMVPAAIGTDTGGSIRVPASFCGVAGFKPSYDAIDVKGVHPLAPSLDHVGPIARHPNDLRRLVSAMMGVPRIDFEDGRRVRSLEELKIGVSPDLHQPEPSSDNEAIFSAASRILETHGATIITCDASRLIHAADTFTTIMVEESLRTHRAIGLYPERATEYGEDVRQRITLAEQVSQQAYADAERERRQIADAMRRIFDDVDIIVSLCAGDKVPKIASLFPPTEDTAHEFDIRRVVLGYTALQNLTGLPACAVRAGFDRDGLPLAVQFTGPAGSDNAVLDVAQLFYDATADLQSQWPDC